MGPETIHSRILHIVGEKNSGKTTLLEFLIRELSNRGFTIGAWKHSIHSHPLDKPGSDSDRLRAAGAVPVVFSTPEGLSIFVQTPEETLRTRILKEMFKDVDLLLIESFRKADGPKIVLCESAEELQGLTNVIAVVSLNPAFTSLPTFFRNDPQLVDFILKYFHLTG